MAAAKPCFSPHAASPGPEGTSAAVCNFTDFRLILPSSFSDADSMRLQGAVNQLRHRTASLKVRVEPLDASSPSSSGSVAAVFGPSVPNQRGWTSCSSGEPLSLSPAQEALVSVIDVDGVLHLVEGRAPESVKCLFLVEAARFEAAAGKGVLGRIVLETCAHVHVVPREKHTPPLGPPEVVVEITGDRTVVRKAIVILSSYLQGNPSVSSSSASVMKQCRELLKPHIGTLCSEASTEVAQKQVPQIVCPDNVTKDLHQVSFRLLCPINIAGGLMGKNGSIVYGIEDETGACIDIDDHVSGCMDHVVTISALKRPDSEYQAIQSALLCVFDRMMEVERSTYLRFKKLPESMIRALVPKSQFGCLVGTGGSIIKEMMNETGAKIQVLEGRDVSACISPSDLVLHITGELLNVRDALAIVSWKLCNHVFPSKSTNYNNSLPSPDVGGSNDSFQFNICSEDQYSTDRVDLGHSRSCQMDSVSALQLDPPEDQKPANANCVGISNSDNGEWNDTGIDSSNYETKLPKRVKTARVTRITFEIAVPGSSSYLVSGSKLDHLKEVSGADITVYDPPSGGNEATIVISGRPAEAKSAERMLADLILQGQ